MRLESLKDIRTGAFNKNECCWKSGQKDAHIKGLIEKGFNCFLKRKFGGIQLNFSSAQSFPCEMSLRETYFGGFGFNLQFVFSGVSCIIFLTLKALKAAQSNCLNLGKAPP